MKCAGEGARGQESLVELEVLVTADALHREQAAVGVDHEDLVRAVDPGHLHRAVGNLLDAEQVDPSHAAASAPVSAPASHLASSSARRRSCASASGTRATTGSRKPMTMNFRA